MEIAMNPKDQKNMIGFWTRHLERRRASGETRAGYCRANDLNRDQMSYWEKRIALLNRNERAADTPRSDRHFAKIAIIEPIESKIQPVTPNTSGSFRLKFSCGLMLELSSESGPNWVACLIKSLARG